MILNIHNKKQYFETLSNISNVLSDSNNLSKYNTSLFGGQTGVALFFFYYSRLTGKKKYSNLAYDILLQVFERINNGVNYHTFSVGLAGVAWTINHLIQHEFLNSESKNQLLILDQYIANSMIKEIDNGNYDFLHGAIGGGVYLLNRLENSNSLANLTLLVKKLETLSEKDKNGALKWKSELNIKEGTLGYNISLSHGIASIIVLLSKLLKLNISSKSVEKMLKGAIKYLLQQELEENKYISRFSGWSLESSPEIMGSRLAWCYGDLGIGIALWQASKSLKDKGLENKAIEILLHSTHRRELKKNMVIDAGICHGSAGIAHVYNRIYINTGIDDFYKVTNYWFEQTLKMTTFNDGYAGYKAWHAKSNGGWTNEVGVLEGVSGIGLAIISYISEIEPKWDECLLLS